MPEDTGQGATLNTRLAGRVCVVTGGTKGLGRAISVGLAQAGGVVVMGSRGVDNVRAAVKDLTGQGLRVDGASLDVGDPASVREFFAWVKETYGRVDVLVTAAGITKRTPTIDLPLEEWDAILRVNLTGTLLSCQAAGQLMRDQEADRRGVRGAIVTISSLAAFVALKDTIAYGCSKAAVVNLTKCLANDWAELGIRVNSIAPGVFPTDLNRALITGTPRGDWFLRHTPMNRFGDTEEIAGAAVYLASPDASFVTGETLVVDGGFLARGNGLV